MDNSTITTINPVENQFLSNGQELIDFSHRRNQSNSLSIANEIEFVHETMRNALRKMGKLDRPMPIEFKRKRLFHAFASTKHTVDVMNIILKNEKDPPKFPIYKISAKGDVIVVSFISYTMTSPELELYDDRIYLGMVYGDDVIIGDVC